MTDYEEMRRAIDEQNAKHDALLETLEIPDYTGRSLQAQWVKRKEQSGDYFSIEGTTGWTAGTSKEVFEALEEGDPYILETATRGNLITGFLIRGTWFDRKSNQDLERYRQQRQEESDRKAREYYEAHKDDWERRFEALPEWAKGRLQRIRETNPDFDTQPMGFGYELVATEVAVLYAAMGDVILDKGLFDIEDSEEISTFARENGTSGNQHGFALAFAKAHLRGEV